jgi:hypothetical protein
MSADFNAKPAGAVTVAEPAGASKLYRVVDNRTNMVAARIPDEAVLRRRAYFHALDLIKGAPSRPRLTDRKA